MSNFSDLGLRDPILRAIKEGGYEQMTPIQSRAIPNILEGKDLIGVAQTGTGKTAAFSLPLIQYLLKGEGKRKAKTARSLILAPTRELAIQISDNVRDYSKYLHLRSTIVFGGASEKPQIKAMAPGVDILIATPGRLLDLMSQGHIKLNEVEFLVLDEADRMLDMGFIRDIKKIIKELPDKRQTVLLSATMPKSVTTLANTILINPVRVEVAPAATTAEKVEQHVMMVPKSRKRDLLGHVLKDDAIKRVLIFTRTKHGANRVSEFLEKLGITSAAIHGNKSQNARQRALADFRDGAIRALVATDVAARGIDVDGVTHVINFELPNEPDSYVHRIGRTARAGATGISYSFCDHEERAYLKDIEKNIRQSVPVFEDHPYHEEGIAAAPAGSSKDGKNGGRPNRNARNGKPSNGKPGNKSRRGNSSKPTGKSKPTAGRQDAKPNQDKSGQGKSGSKPNNNADNKSGNRANNRPGNRPSNRSANKSRNRPGNKSSNAA
ncbi:DEAD/DEAH box helicase [Kiloniella spongiae]|uniref:DEAD-box ATP-dependent RNA helicase RhpA n=1 Tax=Kiloniella spongiae TaxID=1489064 RepID=A0A0H2MM02_9PROT|nr:DEAD/DEAH box helicase [Kiloniella spongiae]KLN61772.1 DEAD/DEAH box helicase [Kiloniella spongiae]